MFGDYRVTMRLFKLLAILIIIGSIYFYAKQQDSFVASVFSITTTTGVSVDFPKKPVKKTFNKNLASFGKSRLITYQSRTDNLIFILLSVQPEDKDIRNMKITELERIVHEINDTGRMSISNRQYFVQQSYRGLEYRAILENGDSIWCRTVKRGDHLVSLIVAGIDSYGDVQSKDVFFQSLRL